MRKPLERYLGLEYPALLAAEPEGGYTALHPDLKGCVAVGETPAVHLGQGPQSRGPGQPGGSPEALAGDRL
jgi:hypothetical protein